VAAFVDTDGVCCSIVSSIGNTKAITGWIASLSAACLNSYFLKILQLQPAGSIRQPCSVVALDDSRNSRVDIVTAADRNTATVSDSGV
jgi:hypothetical protein